MKFTFSWLKDYLDTDASVEATAETLTSIGLEVEELHDPAQELAPFVVGEVTTCAPHPDADKLQVCQVATGTETLQVICGAPNARAGMKGVFAPAGTTVPGTGMHLKKAKIRGVESNGMLCSEKELGISDEHGAIIELPDDAQAGEPVAGWLGLDEPVIDIAITPNRQDCLGVLGVARDLAAAGMGAFRAPETPEVPGTFESPVKVHLQFTPETSDACPLFLGRTIQGVRNGPSPEWLQQRLKAIGLRPISALVDITNYLTFDQARPLHVYDADKLDGDIIVRLAKDGEKVAALDGETYELTPEMTVIADEAKALGLGGVIGGEETGCTEETVNVFLEAAYFDPVRTAKTGRKLGIGSDARYRFERGVDPAATRAGMEKATQLIQEICGGTVSEVVTAGTVPDITQQLTLRPERVAELGGITLERQEMLRILEALGFAPADTDGVIHVTVPSWRRDVHGEADLVEEIARIHGYDHIRSTPLPAGKGVFQPALTPRMKRVRHVKRTLAARGMAEAVTWSFTGSDEAGHFGGGQADLTLANPISSELDVMRPSILPGLLTAAQRNIDHGVDRPALFEVGPVFAGLAPEEQETVAAGLRQGARTPRHWTGKAEPVDVFDAKADALAVLEICGIADPGIAADAPDWYHPGRSGRLTLGPKTTLATFGELHPRILKALDIDGPVAAFEVHLDAIPYPRKKTTGRTPLDLADLPAVERDLAFVLDRDVPAGDVIAAAKSAEKALIESVAVFDIFEGAALGEGKKSLALTVRLQPREKTLTDAEIDAVTTRIIETVQARTGGELRR